MESINLIRYTDGYFGVQNGQREIAKKGFILPTEGNSELCQYRILRKYGCVDKAQTGYRIEDIHGLILLVSASHTEMLNYWNENGITLLTYGKLYLPGKASDEATLRIRNIGDFRLTELPSTSEIFRSIR